MSASPAHTLPGPTDGRNSTPRSIPGDTTFEVHYSIADLAKQWRLGRETVRLLIKTNQVWSRSAWVLKK
jgi:hypothetical protein